MLKILCINGAPGVGKDTAGKLLKEIYGEDNVQIMKFAKPLDQIAAKILGMTDDEFASIRETHKGVVLRDRGCLVSLRTLLITISEDLIKPCMGNTWFAIDLAKQIAKGSRDDKLIVITDSGFQYEYDAFKEAVSGFAQVKLIHMTRQGCSFDGDSREKVIDKEDESFYLNNDATIDDLKTLLQVEFF